MKYYSKSHERSRYLRPPDLYEYYVDNYWFKTVDLENQVINEPLRGTHKADIVILGGGFTGLSSAYHIREKFPNKKIVLLEGACCGYGASGRNGGFCIATDLIQGISRSADEEVRKRNLKISLYGPNFIKRMITEHDVDCEFEENGMLGVAFNDHQAKELQDYKNKLEAFGLDSYFLQGDSLNSEINSPRFVAALDIPHGAILNPAKLAREMKRVVEEFGVGVRERTVVTHVIPGITHHIDTELGEISAPILVIALNAYAYKLGFFKDRVFPVNVFQIATEPLNDSQWDSIGWQNRQGLYDMRTMFSYLTLTPARHIVMGGSDVAFYANDALCSGNDKSITRRVIKDLFSFFPQLEGLKIEHAWGGSTTHTLNRTPSVGVMGDHHNIYYGVGLSEGVPTTQTFGRIIADLMAGESNDYTKHYVVNRVIPYAGPGALRGLFAQGVKLMMNRN